MHRKKGVNMWQQCANAAGARFEVLVAQQRIEPNESPARLGQSLGLALERFGVTMQMYTTTMTQPDPERFMDQYLSREVSSKANKWQGRNITRWVSDDYDKTYQAAESELDPVKRAALFIRLNDLPVKDNIIIPLISRPRVRGSNLKLVAPMTGWDLDFSQLQNWYRETGAG